MGIRIGICIGVASLTVASAARATPERFGERGQLAIDQSFSLAVSRFDWARPQMNHLSNRSLVLSPTVSWFVAPRVSLSFGVTFAHTDSSAKGTPDLSTLTSIGGSLGAGYAVSLGDHFSVWPNLGAALTHGWFEQHSSVVVRSGRHARLDLGAAAMALWHPADHFFIGLGPSISLPFGGPDFGELDHDVTIFSLASTVGGYFSP